MFDAVRPTQGEIDAPRAGDDLVPHANVVMDRAFTLAHTPPVVWPWIVQLGKQRAGWYLPRWVERAVPPKRRAIQHVDPRWQDLRAGDVIPDYGGKDATFDVAVIDAPTTLVYTSRRGHTDLSWSITLTATGHATRVHLRLRLGAVRHPKVAELGGGVFDLLTIAGMAAGLRERLGE